MAPERNPFCSQRSVKSHFGKAPCAKCSTETISAAIEPLRKGWKAANQRDLKTTFIIKYPAHLARFSPFNCSDQRGKSKPEAKPEESLAFSARGATKPQPILVTDRRQLILPLTHHSYECNSSDQPIYFWRGSVRCANSGRFPILRSKKQTFGSTVDFYFISFIFLINRSLDVAQAVSRWKLSDWFMVML